VARAAGYRASQRQFAASWVSPLPA
jgi:hypothetical protein